MDPLGSISEFAFRFHSQNNFGLHPDDGVLTDRDLLRELTRCHPSVDGGATIAYAIQEFGEVEDAWWSALFWHHSSSFRSTPKKNPENEKRPFSTTGGASGSGAASSASVFRTPLTAPSWGKT